MQRAAVNSWETCYVSVCVNWWQVPDNEALYTGELYTNPNDFSSKVSNEIANHT